MRKLTTDEFIKRAKKVHGDKYDYSKVEYKGTLSRITITCPIHGDFIKTPARHIEGFGCPKCGYERNKTLIYGVAKNDLCVTKNTPLYKTWFGMLTRCYDKNANIKGYDDCSVCEEWLTLSNFKKWFDDNYKEGYVLDKDIAIQGNREYSPNACSFVPSFINGMFIRQANGKYMRGVRKLKNGKYAIMYFSKDKRRKFKSGYNTEMEAFLAFKEIKENHIKEVATEYYNRGEITKRVYDAMMRYEVKPTD